MLNDSASGGRRYQDQVPAVARAVRVLEWLATSHDSPALADLARELDIGASSLLAILTTLRQTGLVSRTAAGRYEVGPGLAALGSAASCRLRACEQFPEIADQLVSATGETVLLWVRHEDMFIVAAAREGTQPLRYVPTPGLRLRVAETRLSQLSHPASTGESTTGEPANPVGEEELLPGIWMVAATLRSGTGDQACVALTGPQSRLATPAVRAALVEACGTSDSAPHRAPPTTQPIAGVSPSSASFGVTASGPIDGDELDDFLGQSLVATLSYLAEDGYPTTVPLWYAWDGAAFWLTSRPGSEWVEHVRLDPRVSLAISESTPPLRRVLARGSLIEVADPGGARWSEIEGRLAARYAGFDAAREPATAGRGRLLELKPERLIAWRGLLRHPKLPPGPEDPGTTAWRNLG